MSNCTGQSKLRRRLATIWWKWKWIRRPSYKVTRPNTDLILIAVSQVGTGLLIYLFEWDYNLIHGHPYHSLSPADDHHPNHLESLEFWTSTEPDPVIWQSLTVEFVFSHGLGQGSTSGFGLNHRLLWFISRIFLPTATHVGELFWDPQIFIFMIVFIPSPIYNYTGDDLH